MLRVTRTNGKHMKLCRTSVAFGRAGAYGILSGALTSAIGPDWHRVDWIQEWDGWEELFSESNVLATQHTDDQVYMTSILPVIQRCVNRIVGNGVANETMTAKTDAEAISALREDGWSLLKAARCFVFCVYVCVEGAVNHPTPPPSTP